MRELTDEEKKVASDVVQKLQKKCGCELQEINVKVSSENKVPMFIAFDEYGEKLPKERWYIRLTHTSQDYFFPQMVYQYAHEYMHYILQIKFPSQDPKRDWFEEVICEAVSFYILSLKTKPEYKEYLKKTLKCYEKGDDCIADFNEYLKSSHNQERPALKISIDLFRLLSIPSYDRNYAEAEEVWSKILSYDATKNPMPLSRPDWLEAS